MFIKLNMMEKFIFKHLSIFVLVVMLIGINQPMNAQLQNLGGSLISNSMDWQFDCLNSSEVEIIGTGTQIAGNPPMVLNIPNYANADSIMLEIVYKGATTSPLPTSAVISSTNGQYLVNTNPVILPAFGTQYIGGVFRTMMLPASSYSVSVQPPGSNLVTWALIAYVYRSGNAQGKSSTGTYSKALILNNTYTIKVPVPVTAGLKDIRISAPIVELDYEPNRIAVVEAIAGQVVGYDTLAVPNFGLSFALNPFTLYNVAGSVDTVIVNLISPTNGTGDSFIGGVMVEINDCCTDVPLAAVNGTTSISCYGSSDGAIDLNVTGGLSPFIFEWSNGSTTEDIINIHSGQYSVNVFDTYGCSSSASFNLTEPSLLKAAATRSNINCFAGTDGAIDLKVWGGTPPYTYLWNDGIVTQDRDSLSAGLYSVIITDANGCSKTINKGILQPAKLRSRTIQEHIDCYGNNNGSINLTTRGGVSPYTYLWNDGATNEDRDSLSAGNYNVIISDAKGCSLSINRRIKQPNLLKVGKFITRVSCNGGNDGKIALNIYGGTKPYSVIWSNGNTGKIASNLVAGNYTATVTDANGCEVSRTYTVKQFAPINISVNLLHLVSGYNMNDGSVNVQATGGKYPYTYLWSNGSVSKTQSNLVAGSYTVLVTDANNCTAVAVVTLTQPDSLILLTTHTDVNCNGEQTGYVDVVSLTGGVPPYQYFWSTGDTTPYVGGLPFGTYNLIVTDANGNVASSQELITQPTPIQLGVTNTPVSCNGASDGTIDLTVSGGVGPFAYVWSNQQGIQDQQYAERKPGKEQVRHICRMSAPVPPFTPSPMGQTRNTACDPAPKTWR